MRFLLFYVCLFCLGSEVFAQTYKIPFRRDPSSNLVLFELALNGVSAEFIFDTGASSIVINRAFFRKMQANNRISVRDQIGQGTSTVANGSSVPITVFNIKDVSVPGGLTLQNIEAVLINTANAPLLVGQTFFANFGLMTIDNVNKVLILEKQSTPSTQPAQSKITFREVRFIPASAKMLPRTRNLEWFMADFAAKVSKETQVPPPAKALARISSGITLRYFSKQDAARIQQLKQALEAEYGSYGKVNVEDITPYFNSEIPGYLEVWVKE